MTIRTKSRIHIRKRDRLADDPNSLSHANLLVEQIEQGRPQVDLPQQVIPRPFAPPSGLQAAPATGGVVEMELLQEFGDYLRCRLIAGGDTDIFNVAKPPLLRRSSFDQRSVDAVSYNYSSPSKRVASGFVAGQGTVQETHILTPPYKAFDIISVQRASDLFAVDIGSPILRIFVPLLDSNGEPIVLISVSDNRNFLEDVPL